jgi:two-component system, NtrC family, sensor kinase
METARRLIPASYRRVAQVFGTLVAAAGIAVLAGWATGNPVLLGLRARYVPMSPNTALAFVALGSGLVAIIGGGSGGRRFAGVGAVLVGVVGVVRVIEYATGAEFAVDRWFIPVEGERFGLAPSWRMSLPSASTFVAASAAVLILAWPKRRRSLGHAAGVCGVITAMMGLIFSLGYLFSPNAPLLYGSASIPMALNTALCFIALGVGIVTAAGPRAFPLIRLSGPSIQARLLRTFLPLVMGTVGVVAWITHVMTTTVGASSAALSSAALAAAAICLFSVLCERIAGHVGKRIETAEAELRQARDLLEIKVEERTQELSRANADLAEALRDTQLAHESLQQAHLRLKQAQSRMLQQARLASLGETAAGVAHEINNPLAFVTNNLVVLKREFHGLHDIILLYQQAAETMAEYESELYSRISHLAEEVDLSYVLENLDSLLERSRIGLLRIQKIVADLRDFSHLEEADFKEVDLNVGISTTLRLMKNIADNKQVALEANLLPIPKTTCFPAKINLVVQSLVSNAIDACQPGGRVVVESLPTADGVEIRVADDGCGIADSIRDKIFDPFFTTKPVGKGTGLGLSISYGILKDHGGTIDFESAPGKGTRFRVRIPAAPPSEPALQQEATIETQEPMSPI